MPDVSDGADGLLDEVVKVEEEEEEEEEFPKEPEAEEVTEEVTEEEPEVAAEIRSFSEGINDYGEGQALKGFKRIQHILSPEVVLERSLAVLEAAKRGKITYFDPWEHLDMPLTKEWFRKSQKVVVERIKRFQILKEPSEEIPRLKELLTARYPAKTISKSTTTSTATSAATSAAKKYAIKKGVKVTTKLIARFLPFALLGASIAWMVKRVTDADKNIKERKEKK